MEKIVTLNLSELNEIIKALDLYSRIDIGQYDEIVRVNCWFFSFIHNNNRELENLFAKIRSCCIPKLSGQSFNTSLGIWGPDTPLRAKRAYDIQQILRYQLAYHDNPNGGNTANFNSPYIHGKWTCSKESIKIIKKTIQKFGYPDYIRFHNTKYWECPIVITEFLDKKHQIKLQRDPSQIDSIIEAALKIYHLAKDNKITELFNIMYPNFKKSIKPSAKEIEVLLLKRQDYKLFKK